jgi:hypothetical protein
MKTINRIGKKRRLGEVIAWAKQQASYVSDESTDNTPLILPLQT